MIPAFSPAISPIVSPRYFVWSSPTGVTTATRPSATLGRVPRPAHADLDHRDVDRRVRERGEPHRGEHLEVRQRDRLVLVDQLQVRPDVLVRCRRTAGR
jgi:hypothetical protein